MKSVDQTIVLKDDGDCMRACIASLFELSIEQVPHFLRFDCNICKRDVILNKQLAGNKSELGTINSFSMLWNFLRSLGWDYNGCGYPSYKNESSGVVPNQLNFEDSVDGYFYASVPSRTFENKTHSVIINQIGVVVHDPNPNKKWQGINILESKDLQYWYLLSRKNTVSED